MAMTFEAGIPAGKVAPVQTISPVVRPQARKLEFWRRMLPEKGERLETDETVNPGCSGQDVSPDAPEFALSTTYWPATGAVYCISILVQPFAQENVAVPAPTGPCPPLTSIGGVAATCRPLTNPEEGN